MKKQTIAKPTTLAGKGLHTGEFVNLTIHPAGDNHGIKFKRTDLDGAPVMNADVNLVTQTNRGTKLGNSKMEVGTVEHLMSALYALGVDNALIELDGTEVPIMDGSALPFVEAIKQAGIVEQESDREYFEVEETITYTDEETGAELVLMPSDKYEVTTMIDFDSPVLGQQYAELYDLAKITQDSLDVIAKKVEVPDIEFNMEGIVNKRDLKYSNEPARHKLLDVIGDLALVGKPIKGKIVATRPGHKSNIEFAKIIKKHVMQAKKLKGKPKYDANATPVYDIEQVKAFLPHRYPFLMVDKVIQLESDLVVGVKNVTGNENFFPGHFPGNPVFPGVLQMEALAQTGGILALHTVDDPKNWDTYFLKMDNVKFKRMVKPGDTIILKMALLSPIRRGIVMNISNLSQVHPDAQIGKNVTIEPFCVIDGDVEIGENTWIGPHVTIMNGTRIGSNCKVFPGTVLGSIPQDLKFEGEDSILEIGNNVVIREYCTVNRGTKANFKTHIKDGTMLMAYVHVAHDCIIGEHSVLVNNVNLAGHIEIGKYVIMGGMSAVHQFVKIGDYCMIGGGSLVRKDVPPYVKAAREPLSYAGVNSIGLRRRGFSNKQINHIQDIYRILFVKGYNTRQAIAIIETSINASAERETILQFMSHTDRGVMKGFRQIGY